ncbi:MAG: NosR/NirI family nitrous oxide reductase transcriptional regulator [Verrucomicrobiales bacterium]
MNEPISPSRLIPKNSRRKWALHAYRVGVFVFLIILIRQQHVWFVAQKRGDFQQLLEVKDVRSFFPTAAKLGDRDPTHGGQNVLDSENERLGSVVQTSPDANDVIGFSGPTNTMVAIGEDNRIVGISILRSDDTREHLAEIREDEVFHRQWNGLRPDEAGESRKVDGVSGATLTSMSVADGIAIRFGGGARKSRFPNEISLAEVRIQFPSAAKLEAETERPNLLQILDSNGQLIGYASRTSPHADHMMGYQGPTDLLILTDPEFRVTRLALRETFDNAEFVDLIPEDDYFFNTFVGFSLEEITQLDMVEMQIDGVSGATKTSVTVAEGLIHTAGEITRVRPPRPAEPLIPFSWRDLGTATVVLAGLAIAFTRLRGKKWLRIGFQLLLVGYLGFINSDMLSQAQLVGWAQNGIAWKVAPALALLTVAALVAPVFTGRQVFCTHLCPFGAVQDLVARRLPWQLAIRGKLELMLSCLPVVLLVWVVAVAMGHLPFSLIGIEPFDAFVFRIAGWATIAVAVVGLIASLFVNRAYCRYGCPTGAMLKFIRFSAASDRLGTRDFVAAALVLGAVALMIFRQQLPG